MYNIAHSRAYRARMTLRHVCCGGGSHIKTALLVARRGAFWKASYRYGARSNAYVYHRRRRRHGKCESKSRVSNNGMARRLSGSVVLMLERKTNIVPGLAAQRSGVKAAATAYLGEYCQMT